MYADFDFSRMCVSDDVPDVCWKNLCVWAHHWELLNMAIFEAGVMICQRPHIINVSKDSFC